MKTTREQRNVYRRRILAQGNMRQLSNAEVSALLDDIEELLDGDGCCTNDENHCDGTCRECACKCFER